MHEKPVFAQKGNRRLSKSQCRNCRARRSGCVAHGGSARGIKLQWTSDPVGGGPSKASDEDGARRIDQNGVSIFTAIEEQLGLRLESAKGPVDILVVDSVQRPSEN